VELKRRTDEIERKTRETDNLNRKLERLLAAQPGEILRLFVFCGWQLANCQTFACQLVAQQLSRMASARAGRVEMDYGEYAAHVLLMVCCVVL
jgi:hypothetical protein